MPSPTHTSATALFFPAALINHMSAMSTLAVSPSKLIPSFLPIRDDTYGGLGKIVGTTFVKGAPDFPVGRRVRLFRDVDGQVVRGGWSDAAGNYSFLYINPNYKYSVVAYDHLHSYRAVIADNLTPDPMP